VSCQSRAGIRQVLLGALQVTASAHSALDTLLSPPIAHITVGLVTSVVMEGKRAGKPLLVQNKSLFFTGTHFGSIPPSAEMQPSTFQVLLVVVFT